MTNKIALITGASRGLGRASAVHLAKAGTHIIGTYNASKDEAAEVAREIETHGVKAAMLPFDAEADDFAAFAEQISDALQNRFGTDKLDHIVNNAGIGVHASIADTTADQLDQLYKIHFRTPFMLTQALLPHIRDGGSVLFVSSGLARFALPGHSAYASMKGAVEVLTRYVAKEMGARGIRANCIAPGAIATDFSGGAVRDNADLNGFVASMTALGRVGEADDIGGAVAAILSDGMRWTNGERIEVSGGQSL
ncbi:SDR family oxidoreductase [Mesorhizobium sp. CAU 1741]|uniref:SDR family NAD(P)-dependent oxidoreductase n=1 Tax=Mesorhizobium sp. CAU 1741 TaxID=3140366 RepID=UPI00325AB495